MSTTTTHDPADGFVPTAVARLCRKRHAETPVRVFFERFDPPGGPGADDPSSPGYGYVDGRAYLRMETPDRGPWLAIEAVDGTRFRLAPGRRFTPYPGDPELPAEEYGLSLADRGPVLGIETDDGYRAVGVHASVMVPEQP